MLNLVVRGFGSISVGEIGVLVVAFVSSASAVWAIGRYRIRRLIGVNQALKQELLEQEAERASSRKAPAASGISEPPRPQ